LECEVREKKISKQKKAVKDKIEVEIEQAKEKEWEWRNLGFKGDFGLVESEIPNPLKKKETAGHG